MRNLAHCALSAAVLTGCASTYGPESLWGGYSAEQIGATVWWVSYGGNGYTTEETAQTYWLFRCAELALTQGYDGFEIISDVELTTLAGQTSVELHKVRLESDVEQYSRAQKPWVEGSIRLLRHPFEARPGRVFDAEALRALLDEHVNGEKCGGNVCPHVHSYLYQNPPPPKR